jgi:Zn-dependent membrane protease YugP
MAGIVALATAIVGAVAGACSYVLYTAELVGVDASATLIVVSVLFALAALPVGYVAWRRAEKRGQENGYALAGIFVALGTLGSWFVVVAVALGK